MKHAFLKVVFRIIYFSLAHLYKYACKKRMIDSDYFEGALIRLSVFIEQNKF